MVNTFNPFTLTTGDTGKIIVRTFANIVKTKIATNVHENATKMLEKNCTKVKYTEIVLK